MVESGKEIDLELVKKTIEELDYCIEELFLEYEEEGKKVYEFIADLYGDRLFVKVKVMGNNRLEISDKGWTDKFYTYWYESTIKR